MPVLTFYFFRRIGGAIALLWFALTALIVTLQLVAEADGRSLPVAALLALLQAPRLAMETLPFACVIAAAAALQRMEESRELQTMRAAGLSLARAAALTGVGGAIFAAFLIAAGEFLLEPSESLARAFKNAPAAKGEVWLHHQGEFFYARQITPGGQMQGVAVYVPKDDSLQVVSADRAHADPQSGKWQLTDGKESILKQGETSTEPFAEREWQFPLPASALQSVIRHPREMSGRSLASAASGLRDSGSGVRFAVALWQRIAAIPAIPLLAACAICCVAWRRRVTIAVLFATALSGAYYFTSILSVQFALLLHAPLLAAAPLFLLLAALTAAARKRFT